LQVLTAHIPAANRGFVRDIHGVFATFDPPKSSSTIVSAMSPGGTVVGSFDFAQGHDDRTRSFIRFPDGAIVTFTMPGATFTAATGISSNGAVVGYYSGADNVAHGFLREPK
jgi:probable HAF family extracellular repeat protein